MSRWLADAGTPAERRNLAWFGGAVFVLALTWLLGVSLRLAIWSVAESSLRTSGIRKEITGRGDFFAFAAIFLLIVAAYGVALWAVRRGFPHGFRWAILGSVLATAAVLPQMPLVSPDTMHFAADVRTLWLHGEYPARRESAPSRQDDPIAQQVITFKDFPSGYGPVTYAVGGAPIPFAGDSLRASIFGQKALSGVLYIVIAVLGGVIAGRIGRDPAFVTAAIGLNPLFLLEFAGDGHNDTVMVALAMLAVLLAITTSWRSRTGAAAAGVVSALAKFSMLVAAPIVAAWWFPRWRRALAGLFFVGATAAIILLRMNLRAGLGTSGPLIGTSENTPWHVFDLGFDFSRESRATLVVVAYILFFAVTAAFMGFRRLKTPADLLSAIGLQMAVFIFFFSPTLRHWYQLWAFPFVMLAGVRWLTLGALAFTCGSIFQTLVRQWGDTFTTDLGIRNSQEWVVVLVWLVTGLVAFLAWRADSPGQQRAERPASRAARRRTQGKPARGRA